MYTNAGKIWISNKKCVHKADCRERVLGNIFVQGPSERTGRKCFWPWLKYYCRSEQPISSTTIFTSLAVSILYITSWYGRTSLGTESRILLGVTVSMRTGRRRSTSTESVGPGWLTLEPSCRKVPQSQSMPGSPPRRRWPGDRMTALAAAANEV